MINALHIPISSGSSRRLAASGLNGNTAIVLGGPSTGVTLPFGHRTYASDAERGHRHDREEDFESL